MLRDVFVFIFAAAGRFVRVSDVVRAVHRTVSRCEADPDACPESFHGTLDPLSLVRVSVSLRKISCRADAHFPALATYECSITFAEEVEYFWGAPRTGALVVYYLNKYILVFMYVAGVVGIALPGASAEVRTRRALCRSIDSRSL